MSRALVTALQKTAAAPLDKAFAMPAAIYTSEAWLRLEQTQIFAKEWICAGRADAAPNPGDYFVFNIAEHPIFVMRNDDGKLRAFSNVCLHRMMQLLGDAGNCKTIVCPYHAWTYDRAGRLIAAPLMKERPNFDMTKMHLPEIRCETWQGWVYLTLNNKQQSIAASLRELTPYLEDYNMAHYRQIVSEDYVWDTNWKCLTENFMEGYHLPVAHRKTLGGHFPVRETRFASKTHKHFTLQTFTKKASALVGTAHSANTILQGEKRHTSVLVTVYPSHMYSLAPDHLWHLSVQPRGVGKVSIRFGAALAPEVADTHPNLKSFVADVVNFLHTVNAEDRAVVESMYAGMKSGLAKPGPLCWLEREGHEFAGYLARAIKAR